MMGDAPISLAPNPPAHRGRLGLADAMILIAAFAFGLAWSRIETGREVGWTFYGTGGPSLTTLSILRASRFLGAVVPMAGAITIGLALVQLRRAGLFASSLFGKPGLLACLSASVPIVIYSAQRSIAGVAEVLVPKPNPPLFDSSPIDAMIFGRMSQLAYSAGVAVTATWLVSRLGPPRGAPPGMVDRAGRCLGIYWMAMVVTRIVLDALWSLCLGHLL